jgi:hypothetical protein
METTTPTCKDSLQVGNTKKMCEALDEIKEFAAAMDVDEPNVLAILDTCRDALSAPTRNCDRFASLGKASVAFHEECPVDCDNIRIMTFDEWLFSKAAGDN